MNDNYKIFGFKDKKTYDCFLELMKEEVLLKRKHAGFIDESANSYDTKSMLEKTLELEIYNDLKEQVMNNNLNDAWLRFQNNNHFKSKIKNNEIIYKNIFKEIFYKLKNKIWSPSEVINFIIEEENKINEEAILNG